jgi:uncharacterized protein (TIGR00661 family)
VKILYGVTGEGMGHATRSRVILDHLVKKHDVQIVVSGRAHDYLKRFFFNVHEIEGFKLSYEGNEVDRSRTAWDLLKRLPEMATRNFERFIGLGERFRADVVISDFESFAYSYGKHYGIPVVSIDNMQVLNRCQLDLELPTEALNDFRTAKGIVKAKLPGCYHYLITSFFFPPIRKERTSLYPPILRQEVFDARPTLGEHLLVYQTTTTNDELIEILKQADVPCRVYGFRREETIGRIQLRDFSEDGFIGDLASSRGVLATGGFSLMGEAIYLGKPVLAIPLRKQFEQTLNSLYLRKLGYGDYAEQLTLEDVRRFCERLDDFRHGLRQHKQDGNRKILAALDGVLAEIERERASR